jgi:hypothetical protein
MMVNLGGGEIVLLGEIGSDHAEYFWRCPVRNTEGFARYLVWMSISLIDPPNTRA